VGSGLWDRQAPRLSLYDRFVINLIHAQPIARAVILPLIRTSTQNMLARSPIAADSMNEIPSPALAAINFIR
jgi:hypothetical protein